MALLIWIAILVPIAVGHLLIMGLDIADGREAEKARLAEQERRLGPALRANAERRRLEAQGQ